ncbi:AAEL005153-PA [Aedes aegypti]|uniref:AAEL005153-PA n=2 Tax=Aedes aegypti TaxID=7159 RepID=A0A1S4F9P9_AEDAE|nr:uncharacterized protein CG13380 [Aedes aegypti]EAT43431.1 AAEL005153-PA [Aedes aegypti]
MNKASRARPSAKPSNSALANRLVEAARYNPDCICQRPQTKVVCSLCNFASYGRVLRSCKAHPNVYFLMDFSNCPKCKQSYRYLKEVPDDDRRLI